MDPANHVVFEYFAEIFGRMSFTLACWAQLFILTLTCGKWPKWPSLQPFTYQDGYQAVPRLKFRKVSNFVFGDVETMSGLCWSRRSRHKFGSTWLIPLCWHLEPCGSLANFCNVEEQVMIWIEIRSFLQSLKQFYQQSIDTATCVVSCDQRHCPEESTIKFKSSIDM